MHLTLSAILLICVLGLLAAAPATAQTTVTGNKLRSEQFPPVAIEFEASLEYVASSEFVLYDSADAAIHIFVEREGEHRVQRLFWIQFEGYLPSVDRFYDYSDSQGQVETSGHQYYEDTWFWNLDSLETREGSDTEQVLKMLHDHDLVLGPEVIGLRLVRLDAERRNELMIVYLEDLRTNGLPADALAGPDRARFVEAIRTRAMEAFRIEEKVDNE